MAGGVTALLLAGQRPGPDRLVGEGLKALLPVAGRPMLARVVETLRAVPEVSRILILAQSPERLRGAVPDGPDLAWVPSGAGIAASVRAAADGRWPVLVTTADHPLLRAETVSAFLAQAGGCDVAVGLVERRTVFRRFPGNRRTWLKFADGWWTGANLFALNTPAAARALGLWAGVERDRKKGLRIVAAFGPWLLARALTRTIGLARAVELGGRRFGFESRAVALDDPLAAVDVDKPEDLALAEQVLA